MSPRTITASLAAAAMLSVGVSACSSDSGGDTPDAATLTTKAKDNATSARSTSMKVSGSVQGQTVTLDVAGTMDGKNQHRTQEASKAKNEEYALGDMGYFKANREFLASQGMSESQTKQIADKWWSKSTKSDPGVSASMAKEVINQFFSSADGKKLNSKNADVKETSTDGKDTYTVNDPKNPKGAKLVTTREKNPQVVEIVDYASQLTQGTKATYVFSQWNSVPTFKAPNGAKSLEEMLEKSSGKGSSSSPSPSTSK